MPAALRQAGFFNAWTRKEAYVKAVGDGLQMPLDSFCVTLIPGDEPRLVYVRDDLNTCCMHSFVPAAGFVAALAYSGKPRDVIEYQVLSADELADVPNVIRPQRYRGPIELTHAEPTIPPSVDADRPALDAANSCCQSLPQRIGLRAHNERMATGTLVPVEVYLRTVYEPDYEYQDGELIERNVGESPHSWLQGLLCAYIWQHSKKWGTIPFPEQRVQVREGKYMIPDIYVHLGPKPTARVFTEPPLIWIEILSTEDKPIRVARKVKEVVEFGAAFVWVIDPETFESYVTTKNSQYELRDGVFRIEAMDLSIPLTKLEE